MRCLCNLPAALRVLSFIYLSNFTSDNSALSSLTSNCYVVVFRASFVPVSFPCHLLCTFLSCLDYIICFSLYLANSKSSLKSQLQCHFFKEALPDCLRLGLAPNYTLRHYCLCFLKIIIIFANFSVPPITNNSGFINEVTMSMFLCLYITISVS